MAHPMKKAATDGGNAKMRRMTMDYGLASGPANNKLAPTNRDKGEGPEDAIGFGADGGAPRSRSDRAGRKPAITNPIPTYRKGGGVKRRAEGGDVSAIEAANRSQAESTPANRARGGRAKKGGKGKTNVNVIIAPQGGGAGPGAAPPMAAPPMAAAPHPMGPPPGAAPMMKPPMAGLPPGAAGLPMAPGAPGGMPPGIAPPRAKGGKVEMTAGAATGVGRLEKIGKEPHNAGRPQAV